MPRRNIVKELQADLDSVNSQIEEFQVLRTYIETLIIKYSPKKKEDKE